MSQNDPLARFRPALAEAVSQRGATPRPNPVDITAWQAMSMLQKAVRRGRLDLALQAASCLLATDPDRFWRRAGVIAFEDVGVANLETVGIVTASMAGKRSRLALGGEWTVAAAIVARMVASTKNRAADDLFCVTESWQGLTDNRYRLERLPIARLRLIVLTTELLPLRALALRRIFKGGQPDTHGQSSADIGFDVLDELGTAPTTLALAREGYRRTGEMLAPLLALLSLENGIKGDIVDDLLPPETMIGSLPGWALDMFTREGRKALSLLLQNDAGIRDWARTTIGPKGRVEVLAQALFRVESGLCCRRSDGPTSRWLRFLMERECMGMTQEEAGDILQMISAAIPALNQARQEVMGGQVHA